MRTINEYLEELKSDWGKALNTLFKEMNMNETIFSRNVRKSIELKYGEKCYLRKIVAGIMMSDMLDILGGINGKLVSIESKIIKQLPKRADSKLGVTFTTDQIRNANEIMVSGGSACGLVYILERKAAYIVTPGEMEGFNTWTLKDLNRVCEKRFEAWFIVKLKGDEWDVTNLCEYLLAE